MASIGDIYSSIDEAQAAFASLLSGYLRSESTSREQYIRYLSFQYHLTKDVQRYFFEIAAHPDLARRRRLRDFLCRFANEEELHYLVAASDLREMNAEPMAPSLDVILWHAYFRSIIRDRPFIRLGAATILENISGGAARQWVDRALTGSFLDRRNTKFLVLHKHESLPHGDQIMEAIDSADLDQAHFADLVTGARTGTVMYLRMAEWALRPACLARICDDAEFELNESERHRIQSFEMVELDAPEPNLA